MLLEQKSIYVDDYSDYGYINADAQQMRWTTLLMLMI